MDIPKMCICLAAAATMPLRLAAAQGAYGTELERLWRSAVERNGDVLAARTDYEQAALTAKGSGGAYAPSVTVGAQSSVTGGYGWDGLPDTFSSSIRYTQPLPGGASLGLGTSYSLAAAPASGEGMYTQTPEVSLSLTQSLYPYWAQGRGMNPQKLNLEQKRDYYYYQLLYTRQQKVAAVTQYYVLCLIYRDKAALYEASIAYRQRQVEAYQQLQQRGAADLSRIMELDGAILNDRQNLAEVRLSYSQYEQSLKAACAEQDVAFDSAGLPASDCAVPLELLDGIADPCAQSLLANVAALKAQQALNAQENAPTVTLSLSNDYAMDAASSSELISRWGADGTASWTA